MAAGAAPITHHPHYDVRWKWPFLALFTLVFLLVVASAVDAFGFFGRPWFGWWDMNGMHKQPFTLVVTSTPAGGAAAQAGVRVGDAIDFRDQSFDTRVYLNSQPVTTRPMGLLIHRGTRTVAIQLHASTSFEGDSRLKLWEQIPASILGILLVACAFLIAFRRAALFEGRMLASTLLLAAMTTNDIVTQDAASSAFWLASVSFGFCGQFVPLVLLSSRFGARGVWRRFLESCAYAALGLNVAVDILFFYGLLTLRIDPLNFSGLWSSGLPQVVSAGLAVSVAFVAVAAVATTPSSERPRAAWLLLPLALALAASNVIFVLSVFVQTSWAASQVVSTLSWCVQLLGAIAVTYALLKRRVLDFEFVLSRTLVVATLSLIVVAAFVLLEWLLGTGLAGASHATGLIANGALALGLGLSMNFIHKRVDTFIDFVFFRKRHEDERALLDFSKEAAYVTESNALLDQAIANLERHTDARDAALLLERNGTYTAARSYGVAPPVVGENDAAILALKTWRKPLDPHHHETALLGALALPMLARGRLLGILLLGEQTGGEAYAPDEVEALSQVAHGVGSALESLSVNRDGAGAGALQMMADRLASLDVAMRALPDAITARIWDGPPGAVSSARPEA